MKNTEIFYSEDPCFGFEFLQERECCCVCRAYNYEKSSIIFYSYPNGRVWFDLVNNDSRMFPLGGLRMHAHYSYNIFNRSGLLEALTNHQEFRITGDLYRESEIDIVAGLV